MRCWGSTSDNVLNVPADLGPVRQVAGYYRAVCAVLISDSTVKCWGNGNKPTDGIVVDYIAGGHYGMCILEPGNNPVRCWGQFMNDRQMARFGPEHKVRSMSVTNRLSVYIL